MVTHGHCLFRPNLVQSDEEAGLGDWIALLCVLLYDLVPSQYLIDTPSCMRRASLLGRGSFRTDRIDVAHPILAGTDERTGCGTLHALRQAVWRP